MVRILLLLVLAVVIVRMLKRMLSVVPSMQAAPAAAPPAVAFTPVAACALCGVHLPISESLAGSDGRNYCCEAHRNQANGPS
jgi:uncharacterized protein